LNPVVSGTPDEEYHCDLAVVVEVLAPVSTLDDAVQDDSAEPEASVVPVMSVCEEGERSVLAAAATATTLDERKVVGFAAFTVEKGEEKARRVKSIVEREILDCIFLRDVVREMLLS
jgi:hypothetical protein